MNDMFKKTNITNVNIKMFAEDCVLYETARDCPGLANCIHAPMQNALNCYIRWFTENCLPLNVEKTKAKFVGNMGKLN